MCFRKLAVGDHLAIYGSFLKNEYFHHGILTSTKPEKMVIDFNGKDKSSAKLREVELIDFIDERKPLFRVNHTNRKSGEETAKQAKIAKNSKTPWEGYNVLHNNCEHFAFFCVTGEKSSEQVSNLINKCLHIEQLKIPKLSWNSDQPTGMLKRK